LGYIYTVHGDNLNKYFPNGKMQYNYNNKSFGAITHIDVSNPLRISVYYQDQASVVFLDNTLSPHIESITLTELGYDQTSLVCTSSNNGIWIYDQNFFELIWLDQNIDEQRKTGNLNQVIGYEINPNFLVEQHQKVYLNDPDHGIFVFDVFGGYIKTIPLKNLTEFQVTDRKIYYRDKAELKGFDQVTLETQSLPLPNPDAKAIHFNGESLYSLEGNALKIYGLSR